MKKILSMVLCLCMVMSLFSGVTLNANAATYTTPPTVNSSYVTERLKELADILEGQYFTTTGESCSSVKGSCAEYHTIARNSNVIASDWFKGNFPELVNLSVEQFPKHYLSDTSYDYIGYHCFGFACFAQWYACSTKSTDYLTGELIYSGTYSGDLIKNTCAPGDVIRYGGHSAVVYSVGETTFKVIDCNYTSSGTYYPSIIRVREINYKTSAFYKEGGDIWISRAENSDPDYVGDNTPSDITTPSTKTQYRYGRYVPQGYESSWQHFCPAAGAYWAEKENRAWKGQPWVVSYYNQSVNDGWSDTKRSFTTEYYQYCDICDSDEHHTINGKTYYKLYNGGKKYWSKYTIDGKSYFWEETRTVCVVHDYSNDCDTTCNRSGCGATRTVAGHKYDNACDTTCNICNATRTITHTYTNDCDTSCNVCGKTRTTTHKYDNNCDTTCNTCGATRSITHTYDNSTDATCNVCGATRNISVTGVTLNKTTASLNVGETVTLTATVSPSTATNKNVTWSSNNQTVATVSNGVVTAKSAGTATITVKTADGSKTATCTVTVKQPILASGECGKNGDNITWILKDTGELILSGSGEMANYENQMDTPWYSYNFKINKITFNGNITTIGDTAFSGITNLKSIIIPDSVTSIGNYAFIGTKAMTTVTLGANVKTIGTSAFYNCEALTDINLHNNITKIGGYAFYECDSLATVSIPSSITSIGDYTFYGCDNLKTINIPESVQTIGDRAFAFCTSLEEIKLPSKVTVINANTFQGCTAFTEIDFLDNITSIEAYAFSECTNITKVTLPKTVTEIKSGAFSECTNITDVYYGGTNTDKANINIGSLNNSYLTNATWHCQEEENIPDENAPQIVVESKTVVVGDEVTVNVSLKNNPGVAYLEVSPSYPAEFELVSVANGNLISDFTKGKNYIWVADEDVLVDDVLVTLTFKVPDTIKAGDYKIGFSLRSAYNYDEEPVEFEIVSSKITVLDFVYGDATGDGVVDGRDILRLKKYLANFDDETQTSTVEVGLGSDATGDGVVDGRDVLRLKKYLANFDDETQTSTVVLGPNN